MPRNEDKFNPDDLELEFDGLDEPPARFGMMTGTLVAIGLVTLLIFTGVLWYAYDSGKEQADEGGVPIIRAEEGEINVKPEDPGGAQFAHQDNTVYNKIDGTEAGVEQLLPGSEEPKEKPQIIRPSEQELPPEGQAKVLRIQPPAAGEKPVPPAGAPEVTAPALPDPMGEGTQASAIGENVPAAPLPEVTTTQPANRAPEAAAQPDETAATLPENPQEQIAALPQPAEAAPEAAVSPAPVGPGFVLQLGAFRTTTAAAAGWKLLSGRHAGILEGLEHFVTEADLGEKGKFFRLQTGPFPDRPAANAKCNELKNAGANCIIVAR
ncbi:MAG: SPOR domain-containing protein [Pseudomonadota bacterium]|jgi:cell division septation protein DedD/cbb3-type cytochrome oxidase subunit 3